MIDLQTCLYRTGHQQAASSYIIRSKETGSRTVLNYNGLPEISVDEFVAVVERFRTISKGEESWWHFEVGTVCLAPVSTQWVSGVARRLTS